MNLAGCSVVQNRLALCDIVVAEGVSKLSFQCDSRDAKFCVSTIWLGKSLIFNVLCVAADAETQQRHVSTIQMPVKSSRGARYLRLCDAEGEASFRRGTGLPVLCLYQTLLFHDFCRGDGVG